MAGVAAPGASETDAAPAPRARYATINDLPPELWTALADAIDALDEAIRNEDIVESIPEDGTWWDSYYLRARRRHSSLC